MGLSLFFLASLTLTCLPLSWSYRDGARSESCYNMLVMHTGFLGSAVPPMSCGSPCQFQLRMVGRVVGENNLTVEEENPTTYQCGEVYQCSTFEGFMVEARENTSSFEEGSTIWGTWVTDPNDLRHYHAVECNRSSSSSEGPFENAATQNSPTDLTSLNLYWRAPNTTDVLQPLPEEIKFWFVTVQQRLTYIYPVEGPVLVREDPQPPTSTAMPFDFPTSTGLPFLMPTDFPPTTSTTRSTTFPSATPTLLQSTLLTPLPFITSTPLPFTTSTPFPPTTRPLELIPIIVGAAGGAIALLLLIILIIVCCICCKRESDYYDKPLEGTRGRFRSTRKKKFDPTSFAIENKAYIPHVLGAGQDEPANGTTKDGDEGYVVGETHAL